MVETRALKRRAALVDYISSLPDAILLHILSFLPLWDLIVVSFVSKRWRNLWPQLSSLTFNEIEIVRAVIEKKKCPICHAIPSPNSTSCTMHKIEVARKILEDSLNRALLMQSCCTINKFSLTLTYVSESRQRKKLDTWMRLLFTSNIEEIDLSFYGLEVISYLATQGLIYDIPPPVYEIPSHHFSPRFLKSLTLSSCKFNSSSFKSFELLRKLVMKLVFIVDPSVTVLMSRCPALEDLHMENCIINRDFLQSEEDLAIKGLYLDSCFDRDMFSLRIDISAPNLERLTLVGCIVTKSCVRKATKLLSAKIDITPSFLMSEQEIHRAFASLQSCRTLRLTTDVVKVLPQRRTMIPIILFCHLVELSLVGELGKQELPRIVYLLGRCQRLELLNIEFEDTQNSADQADREHANEVIPDFDEDNFWQSQDGPYSCTQKHLKGVIVSGFTGAKLEKNLMRFLLAKAEILELMYIDCISRSNPRSLMTEEVVAELMGFQRASRKARVWTLLI